MPHLAHPLHAWPGAATPIVTLLFGIALLLFGRRLFWLFVGVIGFMAGWYVALAGWRHAPAGTGLLLALVGGVIGVVLALVFQKAAVALAGFFVGAYLLAGLLGWDLAALRPGQQLVLLIAGVVAAILALVLFDLALILYSAVAGAGLILDSIHPRFSGGARLLLLVLLAAAGAAVQAHWLERFKVRRA